MVRYDGDSVQTNITDESQKYTSLLQDGVFDRINIEAESCDTNLNDHLFQMRVTFKLSIQLIEIEYRSNLFPCKDRLTACNPIDLYCERKKWGFYCI